MTLTSDLQTLSLFAIGFLLWIALVHVVLAMGVRRGELVWSGRHPRRLDPGERGASALFAVSLVAAAIALAGLADWIDLSLIPPRWQRPAGFVVMSFLGLSALACFAWGSRWERYLFGPMMLFGAGLVGYMVFA
jgi:hypothetical protein